MQNAWKIAGKQAAYGAARQGLVKQGFDVRLGVSLFKDGRVPVRAKFFAVGVGIALIAALELLEVPLEAVIAFLLPIAGLAINIAVDGLEFVVGSLLIASAFLPKFAPAELVQRIKAERDGVLIPIAAPIGR